MAAKKKRASKTHLIATRMLIHSVQKEFKDHNVRTQGRDIWIEELSREMHRLAKLSDLRIATLEANLNEINRSLVAIQTSIEKMNEPTKVERALKALLEDMQPRKLCVWPANEKDKRERAEIYVDHEFDAEVIQEALRLVGMPPIKGMDDE